MTETEKDQRDPIRDALRDLPRVSASADFTRRLRARIAEPTSRRASAWPRLAAAAVILVIVAGGLTFAQRRSQRFEYERQRAALEQRHTELRRELAEVREQAVRSPRLYLGRASDIDLVLDLQPWMEQPSVQPVAYTDSYTNSYNNPRQ